MRFRVTCIVFVFVTSFLQSFAQPKGKTPEVEEGDEHFINHQRVKLSACKPADALNPRQAGCVDTVCVPIPAVRVLPAKSHPARLSEFSLNAYRHLYHQLFPTGILSMPPPTSPPRIPREAGLLHQLWSVPDSPLIPWR